MIVDLDLADIGAGAHVVHLYDDDAGLALAVSGFLGAGLVAGEAALVVATGAHRAAFESTLIAAGVDVPAALADRRIVCLDAAECLAGFTVDGTVDRARFDATVGELVESLSQTGARLRVFGEMVGLLWDEGRIPEAMALEEMWAALQEHSAFTLLCAYPASSVADSPLGRAAICDHHSALLRDPDRPVPRAGEAHRRFEPTPTAARAARRFVTDVLESWGWHAVSDTAALVVSELSSNAIRHGRERFDVVVRRADRSIRIGVSDPSVELPVLGPEDVDVSADFGTGGRGIALVAALSASWGFDVHADGKTVWAELTP